ncbi:acetoacetate decarboxylase [Clostridium autoethanogenum]|uniref:Acetoacetate decarboxylase (ADC) n=2 Tax=Clostridium TaxID=1485 RepID=A0A1A6AVT8_9CLOT|nr:MULTISPECIES: acetoacetate decarboxylase family protein [Clostridium]OBR94199.1 acetoacetate decarboxylase (ADC) [Clostridium ragsdalei P11]RMD01037.1 acetoacetate decarboxylase [Clostridium autoethanogenum]
MFTFEPNKTYSMPPFFGGAEFNPNAEGRVNDSVEINFTQITDGNRLADYLPKGFILLKPELHICFGQYRQIDFLAGGAYNIIRVTVPVYFNGMRDKLVGEFNLVIWENKTAPITGGREESGMPKIYADIEDFHIFREKYFTNASFEGNTFLRMEMINPQPIQGQWLKEVRANHANLNGLALRYIPKIGAPGADLIQAALYPASAKIKSAWIGKGSIQWTKLTSEQNKHQAHIINSLASLPIIETKPAIMTKGILSMKPITGRVLK